MWKGAPLPPQVLLSLYGAKLFCFKVLAAVNPFINHFLQFIAKIF
jgi:hypothetical protein